MSKVSNGIKKSNIAIMHVYLFRHGQKGSSPLADPDLTEFGFSQAHAIANKIKNGEFLQGTQFLASPRKRAQSTLHWAALESKVPIRVTEALDQREGHESSLQFRTRITDFVTTFEKLFGPNDVVYLCTHHDWVEEALSILPADTDLLDSKYWSWHPAQYAHFKIQDHVWELQAFDRIMP